MTIVNPFIPLSRDCCFDVWAVLEAIPLSYTVRRYGLGRSNLVGQGNQGVDLPSQGRGKQVKATADETLPGKF